MGKSKKSSETRLLIQGLITITEARIDELHKMADKENQTVRKLIEGTSIRELKRLIELLRRL